MTWRESPIRSDSGTSSGSVSTAWLLVLGTGKMDRGLNQHHAQSRQGGGKARDGSEQSVDNGVHDLPLVEHHVDRPGKPDQECRQRPSI